MRRPAVLIIFGAVLLIGAVAGFVIVPEHQPLSSDGDILPGSGGWGFSQPSPWSHTAYDAARIGTWALLILGVTLLAVGLIAYARWPTDATRAVSQQSPSPHTQHEAR